MSILVRRCRALLRRPAGARLFSGVSRADAHSLLSTKEKILSYGVLGGCGAFLLSPLSNGVTIWRVEGHGLPPESPLVKHTIKVINEEQKANQKEALRCLCVPWNLAIVTKISCDNGEVQETQTLTGFNAIRASVAPFYSTPGVVHHFYFRGISGTLYTYHALGMLATSLVSQCRQVLYEGRKGQDLEFRVNDHCNQKFS